MNGEPADARGVRTPEAEDQRPNSRYATSLEDLEASARVPVEDQIIEIPGETHGRMPGDDDVTREQRSVINPGL